MEPQAPPQAADVFRLRIGGFTGRSFRVEWVNDCLTYQPYDYAYKPGQPEAVRPSERAWQAFWVDMDRIAAWRWQGHYEPSDPVLDGTGWMIEIARGARRITCSGVNAYPPDGECQETRSFSGFCHAVSRLMGGRDFG